MNKVIIACLFFTLLEIPARATTVTKQDSISVSYYRSLSSADSCESGVKEATVTVTPVIPPGGQVKASELDIYAVDDACVVNGQNVGFNNCEPDGSQSAINVLPIVNVTNGLFSFDLYDKTAQTAYNAVQFSGLNRYTFEVTNPQIPPTTDTNTEEEILTEYETPIIDTNCYEESVLVNSAYSVICNKCKKEGSPQPSINEATFNIRVLDTPVWHETEVGEPLELTLRFSNYASTNPVGSFGAKWSCNWNSSVRVLGNGTNVMVFPSGSIANFTQAAAGVYQPPAGLSGWLFLTNGVYQYRKPEGQTWQYAASSGDTNLYLLERVYDAWSNTVSVTYTNDRLYRVTQTAPNSGRYFAFNYNGTNAQILSVNTETSALRTASFVYSLSGFLTNVVDMGGYSYAYTYTNGYLAGVYKGQVGGLARLLVSYSATPDLWTATNTHWVSLQDSEGRTRKYEWAYGLVTEDITYTTNSTRRYVTVAVGGPRGATIDARGNVRGASERYQYTTAQRLSQRTDKMGGTWSYTYNSNNLAVTMTDPLSHTSTNVYDANGFDLLYTIPPEGPVRESFTYLSNRHVVATASNALGRVITYAYNSLGLVTNATDGRTTMAFYYDAEGRLAGMDRNGTQIQTNQYDAFGRLSWTRNAAGLTVDTTYDALNRITSQAYDNYGQVSVLSNEYDCCHVSRILDRNGREWGFEYNDLGWRLSQTNPSGLTNRWTYGLHGEPVAISNALQWESRAYTDEGWLKRRELPARSFDANSHAENFVYDDEGRLTKQQGLSGAFHRFEYDAKGRKTASYSPDGKTLAFGVEDYVLAESNRYDAMDRKVWTRDIRGLAVSNTFNALDQPTRQDYPDGTYESWTYNTWGEPTSYRDRLGNVTSNLFDSAGRLTRQIDPRGTSTYIGYTDADFVSSISNATLGYAWTFQYDEEGQVTRIDYPNGLVDERSYDPSGNLTQAIRGGVTTVLTYDGLNNRSSVTVGGLLVASNRYDGLGRLVLSQDADGVVVTNLVDSWGDVDGRYWPLNLSEGYQYGDRGLTNRADRLGIATRLVRDSLGRALQVIDGATNTVSVSFLTNGVDQLQYLWDGNSNRTAWAYDNFGNPTTKTYADNSGESYTFDVLNRLTNKTDAASINTVFGYDANGNLNSLKYGSLSTITFAYDALNRRTNMVDGLGTTAWAYDQAGRITSESGPLNSSAVTCQYDTLGRLTAISFGGYSWAYAYDDLGRITTISSPDGDYGLSYYQNGFQKQLVTYPGSVKGAYGYDSLGRLTNLNYSVPTGSLLSITYAYDGGDRRTNETWNSGRKASYGYDNAYQLLSVTSTGQASDKAVFAYDKAGNPVRQTTLGLGRTNTFNNLNQLVSGTYTGGGLTVVGQVNYAAGTVTVNNATARLYGVTFEATNISVSAGSNVITAVYHGPGFTNSSMVATDKVTVVVANTAFGHDLNGNLTNDSDFVYQYDPANRLTNVVSKSSGSSVLVARYDGLGRRREVVRNGTNTERYVYLPGTWLVLAVTDGTNGVKEAYTHGPDLSGTLGGAGGIGGIMGVRQSGASYFLHGDALGNIVLATASNKPVASFQYGAFGQLVTQSGTFDSRFKFSSKEYDREAGLLYFGYRYLSPKQGRWLNRDPIGFRGGLNIYAYCDNSPINYVDPFGLQADDIDGDIQALQDRFKPIGAAARATEEVINSAYELTPIGDAAALVTGKDLHGSDISGLGYLAAAVGMFTPIDEAGDALKLGKKCKTGFKSAEQRKNLEKFKNELKRQLKGKQLEAFKREVEGIKTGEQFIRNDDLKAIYDHVRTNVKP